METAADEMFRDLGEAVVLYARNYINDIEGEKLERMCDLFLKGGTRKVVLDFSNTDLINSIGVSILVGIIERVRAIGGGVFFTGLNRINRDIIGLVGLAEHVDIFDTVDEALAAARKAVKGPEGK